MTNNQSNAPLQKDQIDWCNALLDDYVYLQSMGSELAKYCGESAKDTKTPPQRRSSILGHFMGFFKLVADGDLWSKRS
jgi:hypothetical protein